MPDKILGRGGFGCALYPAIVFRESQIVTEENRDRYVTKIASDAEDEYDIAKTIQHILIDAGIDANQVGIFPVDNLQCGIRIGDLGPIAKEFLEGRCNAIVGRSFGYGKTFFNYRDIPEEDFHMDVMEPTRVIPNDNSFRDAIIGGRGGRKRKRSIKGGLIDKNTYVCALQYEKYDSDFYYLIKNRIRPDVSMRTIANNLISSMIMLHRNNIFHMDIKPPNLCIVGNTPKFADWGFAFIAYPEELRARIAKLGRLTNEGELEVTAYFTYYVSLVPMFDFFKEKLTRKLVDALSYLHDDYGLRRVFKYIDFACLLNAILFYYRAMDPEYYHQQKPIAINHLGNYQ
jgi:hypothetical protein